MEQFVLYENTNPDSRNAYPYFVDVQHGLLDSLNTRVVVPLASSKHLAENIARLCPLVQIEGESFVLLTQQITNVPVSALQSPIGSLAYLRDEIIAALDLLVTGI